MRLVGVSRARPETGTEARAFFWKFAGSLAKLHSCWFLHDKDNRSLRRGRVHRRPPGCGFVETWAAGHSRCGYQTVRPMVSTFSQRPEPAARFAGQTRVRTGAE